MPPLVLGRLRESPESRTREDHKADRGWGHTKRRSPQIRHHSRLRHLKDLESMGFLSQQSVARGLSTLQPDEESDEETFVSSQLISKRNSRPPTRRATCISDLPPLLPHRGAQLVQ